MIHDRPPYQYTPTPLPRLSDTDILERVLAIYEWAVWAADMGIVDFDTFADLAPVILELRLRVTP